MKNVIGNNIRFLREKINLTQQQLADKLNVSFTTISSWETGNSEPKMGMLERIATIFSCDKTDIMDDELKVMYSDIIRRNEIKELLRHLSKDDLIKVHDYITLIISSKFNNQDNLF